MKMKCKVLFAIFAVSVALLFVGCDLIAGNIDPNEGGTHSVSFVTNGGSTVSSFSVANGRTITRPEDPIKVDYTFDRESGEQQDTKYVFIGWYSDEALKERFDFSTKITDDITLYAKWRPVASSKITINGINYEKTEEVYAIDPDKIDDDITTITGSTPSFVDANADSMFIGVFWGGRQVSISPFIISRYEVTQELYEAIMTGRREDNGKALAATPWVCTSDNYRLPNIEGDNEQKYRPVENITWYDAVYFCNKLTDAVGGGLTKAYNISDIVVGTTGILTGHITSATVTLVNNADGYRLPTEAEWEFAARGGDTSSNVWNYMFSGNSSEDGKKCTSDQNTGLDEVGWYAYNRSNTDGTTALLIPNREDRVSDGTHQVGAKSANELGLFDMSGNVYEWCYDIPAKSKEKDPIGSAPNEDTRHVIRGGSWFNEAYRCVVSCQNLYEPDRTSMDIGFRVVRKAPR